MDYTYKKLSAVDISEDVTDAATVLIEEDGKIKRTPKSKLAPELPTDLVRTEQLEEAIATIEEKIPTIPENHVTTEQLEEAIESIPEGFSGSWNDLDDRPFGETQYKIDIGKNAYNSENEYNATSSNGKTFYYLGADDIFPGIPYSYGWIEEALLEITATSEDINFADGTIDAGEFEGTLLGDYASHDEYEEVFYKYVEFTGHDYRHYGENAYLVYVGCDNTYLYNISGGITFPKEGSYISVGCVSSGPYNPGDVYVNNISYAIVTQLDSKFIGPGVVTEEQFEEELNNIKSELSRATNPEVTLVRLSYGDFGEETLHLYEGIKTDELTDADKVLCSFLNTEDDDEHLNMYYGKHEFRVEVSDETNGLAVFIADILANEYTDPDTGVKVYEYVDTVSSDNSSVKVVIKPDTGFTRIIVYYYNEYFAFDPANDPVSVTVTDHVLHLLDSIYLPKAEAISDVTEAPTAEQSTSESEYKNPFVFTVSVPVQ